MQNKKRKAKPGKKRDEKLENQSKKLKKQKKNIFVESEAEETSGEESELDDDFKKMAEIRDKEQDREFAQLIQRRGQRKNVVQDLEEKYKDLQEDQEILEAEDVDSQGEDDIAPPSIHGAKIWRVGCNRGKENESAMSVMFKFANFSVSSTPLEIVSAFALKKFPGVIFIEANFEHQAQRAVDGLYHVRQQGIELVEPELCPGLFAPIEQEAINIEAGSWVRVRSHQIYQGDLGRVMGVNEERRQIVVKVVPREKREIASFKDNQEVKKSKEKEKEKDKSGAKFFIKEEPDEVEEEKIQGGPKHSKWYFRTKYLIEQKRFVRGPKVPIKCDNEKYTQKAARVEEEDSSKFVYRNIKDEWNSAKKDGFQLLHLSANNVLTKNIKPTQEELAYFYPDIKDIKIVLRKIQPSLKQAIGGQLNFQVGDFVFLENSINSRFKVKQILQTEGKLLVEKTHKDKATGVKKIYEYKVDIEKVKLSFQNYQQIVVASGPYQGTQGVIISMTDTNATISTDTNKIIQAQLADLQNQRQIQKFDSSINAEPFQDASKQSGQNGNKPSQASTSTGIVRNDLVRFGQLDSDIGCTLSIQKDEIKVLDITNNMRIISQMSVVGKIGTRNNVAKNIHGNEIRQSDLVVILEGFYKGCKATVLHVYRDNLFLFNGKFDNTQGVIIEKVNNCGLISSVSQTNAPNKGQSQVKVHQNDNNNNNNNNAAGSAPQQGQNLIGQMLTVQRGQWAGYRGLVVGVQAKTVQVQLTAKNLTVKVLREEIGQAAEQGGSVHQSLAPGKTPHYAPPQSVRVWEDLDNQRHSVMHGYQSPYIYSGQTPYPDYQQQQ